MRITSCLLRGKKTVYLPKEAMFSSRYFRSDGPSSSSNLQPPTKNSQLMKRSDRVFGKDYETTLTIIQPGVYVLAKRYLQNIVR